MGLEPRQIEVNVTTGQRTTALLYPAQTVTRRPSTLMLAHGAGAPQLHPFMVHFARALSERGLDVLTFNFLYTEQRRKTPDRMPQLITCYRAAIDAARGEVASARERLFIGGKSMGGRAATHVAADDAALTVAGISAASARAARSTSRRAFAQRRAPHAVCAGYARHVRHAVRIEADSRQPLAAADAASRRRR
jgi:predicted alpha/beta hydrolase